MDNADVHKRDAKRRAEDRAVSLVALRQALWRATDELNFLVLSTPSGNARNNLSEAAIHLNLVNDTVNRI
jgi:hypothetical protein